MTQHHKGYFSLRWRQTRVDIHLASCGCAVRTIASKFSQPGKKGTERQVNSNDLHSRSVINGYFCLFWPELLLWSHSNCKELWEMQGNMRYLLSRNCLALGNIRDGIGSVPTKSWCSQEERGMRWGFGDLGSWIEQPRIWGWSLRKSVYAPKSMASLAWGSTSELVFGAGRCMGFSASGEDFCVKHKSGRSITTHGRDSGEGVSELRIGVSPPTN